MCPGPFLVPRFLVGRGLPPDQDQGHPPKSAACPGVLVLGVLVAAAAAGWGEWEGAGTLAVPAL